MKKAIMPAGICAVLLLTACHSGNNQENSVNIFPVTQPITIDTVYSREYVAEIQAVQNIELRARVTGFLDATYVDEGAYVKKGQTLFTISDREYRDALLKAKAVSKGIAAEVKAAELALQNKRTLLEKNVISRTELDLAQANLEALQAKAEEARADESNAELNLSYTVIKAPFDGVINRIPHKKGSLIEEGTLLTTISDTREMFAWFHMSESEYLEFIHQRNDSTRQEVSLVLADNSFYSQRGIVETVESEIDRNTGNIAFRARFSNPDQLLKHGATGKIVLSQKLKQALIIPQKSTFEIQEKLFVYVLDKDNVVHMHCIVPKYRLAHLFVLEPGVATDDFILYEGMQRVKEGDTIVPETVPMEKIIGELSKQ